jgi:hypothetical protein
MPLGTKGGSEPVSTQLVLENQVSKGLSLWWREAKGWLQSHKGGGSKGLSRTQREGEG